jgi:hypothetical protein
VTSTRLDRRDGALLAATAGLSLALSVPRLSSRPVWLDEAFTVGATAELGTTLRHTGGTMALYYAIVTPIARISDAAFWVRLPSALFGAATVAVVYLIARHLGGRRLAAVAAVLLASSWFLARYAMEARGYALALLLVSLAWLGLVRGIDAERTDPDRAARWWWLFGVATVLAPLAHGLSAMQVPAQVLAVAAAPGGLTLLRRRVAPVVAALAVVLVLLFSIGAGEVANWIPPLNQRQFIDIHRLLLGRGEARWLMSAAFVVGLALIGRDALRGPAGPEVAPATTASGASDATDKSGDRSADGTGGDRRWATLVPALWALGLPLTLITLSLVRPYAAGRYVLSALPGVSLVVASAVVRIRRQELMAALCVVLAGLLLLDQSKVQRNGLEDWPRLAQRVAAESDRGDQLLVPADLRAPFDYALLHDAHDPGLVPLSPTDPIGRVHRFYDTAPGSMRERLLRADGRRVWLVERRQHLPRLERLLADPEVRRRFRVIGSWHFAGPLQAVQLERTDAAR